MANDDERLGVTPAPLPSHEREWRHPSEIGQARRASSRRPAPPLGPLVTSLCGALGLALVLAIVALIMPRDAQREASPGVRNGAKTAVRGASNNPVPYPGVLADDGSRFRIAVEHAGRVVLVSTDVGTQSGSTIALRDEKLGLVVVDDDVPAGTTAVGTERAEPPAPGTDVVVRTGSQVEADIPARVGIALTSDPRRFIPLGGDVLSRAVPEAALVVDVNGRPLGLYTARNGAQGFIPMSALDSLLSRLD